MDASSDLLETDQHNFYFMRMMYLSFFSLKRYVL